jgi:two-component system, cell cycle response regulator DivK
MMKKVLIVEDNELNLKLFTDLLSYKNYQVTYSKDGLNIPTLVAQDKPDIILMDIQLKGVSGIDIIQKLKVNPKTAHIPIIAITAFAMQTDEARIRASGSDDYLSKPVSIELFFQTIEKFINNPKSAEEQK